MLGSGKGSGLGRLTEFFHLVTTDDPPTAGVCRQTFRHLWVEDSVWERAMAMRNEVPEVVPREKLDAHEATEVRSYAYPTDVGKDREADCPQCRRTYTVFAWPIAAGQKASQSICPGCR